MASLTSSTALPAACGRALHRCCTTRLSHHLSDRLPPCFPPHLCSASLPAEALEHLEYPKRLRKLLLTPEREVAVELALLRDNGEVATFNAYRVQHDNSRGPYKVGGPGRGGAALLGRVAGRRHGWVHRISRRAGTADCQVARCTDVLATQPVRCALSLCPAGRPAVPS